MGVSTCGETDLYVVSEYPQQLRHGIVEPIDHPFLQGNDRIVGDGDGLWTDFRAAFRDVAVADSVLTLQIDRAVPGIERVHFEGRRVDQVPGADEPVEHLMIAQHVADVLAEEALDALPELLRALHVDLLHAPRAVARIGG